MKTTLLQPIRGKPCFVSCTLYELIKDKETRKTTKHIIKRVNVVYSEDEATLLRRCERKLIGKKKVDEIEVRVLREW